MQDSRKAGRTAPGVLQAPAVISRVHSTCFQTLPAFREPHGSEGAGQLSCRLPFSLDLSMFSRDERGHPCFQEAEHGAEVDGTGSCHAHHRSLGASLLAPRLLEGPSTRRTRHSAGDALQRATFRPSPVPALRPAAHSALSTLTHALPASPGLPLRTGLSGRGSSSGPSQPPPVTLLPLWLPRCTPAWHSPSG